MDFIKGISRILIVLWALYNLVIFVVLVVAFNQESESFTIGDFKDFIVIVLVFNVIPALIYFPLIWILKGFKKDN